MVNDENEKYNFIAYAASPKLIGETLEPINHSRTKVPTKTWSQLDILGNSINQEVYDGITNSIDFIADISVLNYNVVFEIGYAIAKHKNIILIKNKAINSETKERIKEIGIFDTLGYGEYSNTQEVIEYINNPNRKSNLKFDEQDINIETPIYLLETAIKTNKSIRIASRIKKSKIFYRSFDPSETYRMSPTDVINNIATSIGVVVSWLPASYEDSFNNNIRASFIAGLALGMGKIISILQIDQCDVPIDLRDIVKECPSDLKIDEAIADIASNIIEKLQQTRHHSKIEKKTLLEEIDLGASAAENEFRSLPNYYFKTDQYNRVLRGEARIVCGRKGSGKTALFAQIRNKLRENKRNIVIDLKPESYELIKFKETITACMQEGTYNHTLVAFWEYVLLLEICYKILEKDKTTYYRNPNITELYPKLMNVYQNGEYTAEGDFSERLAYIINLIVQQIREKFGDKKNVRLSSAEVTEIIYKHNIGEIKKLLKQYLKYKDSVWILFDNIDKGWNTDGLCKEDLIIVRTLLDASRKIEQQLSNNDIDCKTVIFLRNDVYELLIDYTPDRGKEARVLIDWVDSAALGEIIKRRLNYSISEEECDFRTLWDTICVKLVKGEDSFQYIIDRTLMRPRALIDCIKDCIGVAINRGHEKIQENDILDGLKQFSYDIIQEISREIRDVLPKVKDALFMFIGREEILDTNLLNDLYNYEGIEKDDWDKLTDFLLWYGVLGIYDGNSVKYIYNTNYDLSVLKRYKKLAGESAYYQLYPTFVIDDKFFEV